MKNEEMNEWGMNEEWCYEWMRTEEMNGWGMNIEWMRNEEMNEWGMMFWKTKWMDEGWMEKGWMNGWIPHGADECDMSLLTVKNLFICVYPESSHLRQDVYHLKQYSYYHWWAQLYKRKGSVVSPPKAYNILIGFDFTF